MKHSPRLFFAAVIAAFVAVSAQAQINNNPPGGSGPGRRGGGAGVEASVVTAARSPEVNANGTITFRLQAPNAKTVRVVTDFPKLGDVPVNGSAGFDMTKDDNGVWSYTSPKLAPSYYQYWFVMDGFTTPDPQNTFVRPASGVYKSVVALPGKEAEFMMFRDVPHGNLTEHHYLNPENKTARRVVIYTPPDYSTSGKSYPVLYLLHGANDYERGWTQTGMANTIMDNLIAERQSGPRDHRDALRPRHDRLHRQTAGSPRPASFPRLHAAGRAADAARRGAWRRAGRPAGPSYMEKDLLGYVMPYVEKEFRVIKDKKARAIMGYSMGGGHSTTIGFGHPELFSVVGGFSGYNRSVGRHRSSPTRQRRTRTTRSSSSARARRTTRSTADARSTRRSQKKASNTSGAKIPATATTTRSGAFTCTPCCKRHFGTEDTARKLSDERRL